MFAGEPEINPVVCRHRYGLLAQFVVQGDRQILRSRYREAKCGIARIFLRAARSQWRGHGSLSREQIDHW